VSGPKQLQVYPGAGAGSELLNDKTDAAERMVDWVKEVTTPVKPVKDKLQATQ